MSLQGSINEEQAKINLAEAILKCRPLITKTLSENPKMTKEAMDKLEQASLLVLNNDTEMLKKVYAISITRLLTVDLDTSVYKANIKKFKEDMKDEKVQEWLFEWMTSWSKKGNDK
jgi:predicted transcriptional regulator